METATQEELIPLFKSLEQRARLKVMELKEDGTEFELRSREVLPHGGRLVLRFTFFPTNAIDLSPIVIYLNDHGETVNWEETLYMGKGATPFSNGNGESANGEPHSSREDAQSYNEHVELLPAEEPTLPDYKVEQLLFEEVQTQVEYEDEPIGNLAEAEPPPIIAEKGESPSMKSLQKIYGIIDQNVVDNPDSLLTSEAPSDDPTEPVAPDKNESAPKIMEASDAVFEFTQKASPWFFMKWSNGSEGEIDKVLDLFVVNPYQNISFGGFEISNLSILHKGSPCASLAPSPASLDSLEPTGFFIKKFILRNCAAPSSELSCQVDFVAQKICLERIQDSSSIHLAS